MRLRRKTLKLDQYFGSDITVGSTTAAQVGTNLFSAVLILRPWHESTVGTLASEPPHLAGIESSPRDDMHVYLDQCCDCPDTSLQWKAEAG